jgi:hypothetical protein
VEKVVVCNPLKNALLKDGNKSDRIDARKLAELLRGNQLKSVYQSQLPQERELRCKNGVFQAWDPWRGPKALVATDSLLEPRNP